MEVDVVEAEAVEMEMVVEETTDVVEAHLLRGSHRKEVRPLNNQILAPVHLEVHTICQPPSGRAQLVVLKATLLPTNSW